MDKQNDERTQISATNVETAYDRWALTYDLTDNPMVFAATHALADGLGAVKGLDCLEFGCGTGRNLVAMAKADPRTLTGIDVSVQMLREAKIHALEFPDPPWKLIQHDVTMPIPLPSASFNFILVSLAFEHIADLVGPLREARRLLRHFGTLRIVEIHPFMTLNGMGAHFQDGEEEIAIASYPHQFEDWFKAIDQTDLSIEMIREWRAHDFGDAAPAKLLRRGDKWPWLVDFTLQAR